MGRFGDQANRKTTGPSSWVEVKMQTWAGWRAAATLTTVLGTLKSVVVETQIMRACRSAIPCPFDNVLT